MATKRGRARGVRLMAIGGAEDPDDDDLQILPRLAELAGGKRARLLVCAAASAEPEPSLTRYRELFEKIGVAEVYPVPLQERAEGDDPKLLQALERATGVFFIGGDQLRITSRVTGTHFGTRLRERFERDGLFVAGTSAGAAALPSTMIIRGEGETVRRCAVELAPGLGLFRDGVIDTHFDRGGRIQRVLTVFAQNPGTLGLGIDEDTAIEVVPERRITVLGRGVVFVFDGRVSHANTAEVSDRDPLALTDARVHVLPAGYGFNLRTKRPIIPRGARAGGPRSAEFEPAPPPA